MLYVSNNKVLLNNSPVTITIHGKCTNIFQAAKKYYMNIEILEGIENLQEIDSLCERKIENYTSFIKNNILLVKLPFRYGKFEIDFKNVDSVDKLDTGSIFETVIECSGTFTDNCGTALCFKMKTLS